VLILHCIITFKNEKMKTLSKLMTKSTYAVFLIALVGLHKPTLAQSQSLPTIAVLGIESNGIEHEADAISYMLRLEIEKLNAFFVMDKYDVAEIAESNNLDIKNCFGKNCVTATGKILGVDKVIAGSVERFGEKIIISIKLYDVKSGTVEKQNATEYLNLQTEVQRMIRVSVKKLIGIEPDPNVVSLLINYDVPIQNPQTKLVLNGPRMGLSLPFGDTKQILMDDNSNGGFDMYPAMFQFGWQQEKQYLSSGNFQALIEGIFLIGGLESGRIVPSVSLINGFRFGKQGWEFGFGPSISIAREASGFFGDGENGTEDGKWYLEDEWQENDNNIELPYSTSSRLDSRGSARLAAHLIFAAGRTFKSGYLNIPVNLYVSPRKEGTVVGLSFGFNIRKDKQSK
jgi:TolB-like protein